MEPINFVVLDVWFKSGALTSLVGPGLAVVSMGTSNLIGKRLSDSILQHMILDYIKIYLHLR